LKTTIKQKALPVDSVKANEIRELLREKNVFMVNLISSPGAGKTALLEHTIAKLQNMYNIAVIKGEMETDHDAKRLEQLGITVSLINTHRVGHIESSSIVEALSHLDLDQLDIIFVENIGNLICPSGLDIGEHVKVAILSVPEGDDKVSKYPLLFQQANLVVLNKIDLINIINFNKENFYKEVKKINSDLSIVEVSCTHDFGIDNWLQWICENHASVENVQYYRHIKKVSPIGPLTGVH